LSATEGEQPPAKSGLENPRAQRWPKGRGPLSGGVERGKEQGTIRGEVDSKVVAWSLMGVSWIENFAILEGLEEFVTDGTSATMLGWILSEISTSASDAPVGPRATVTPGVPAAPNKKSR